MGFKAHFWGDPSPTPSAPPVETDDWYSFSSAVELEREFVGALVRNAGNIPALRLHGSEWQQPTDMQRRGRLLVLSFSFETPLTDEPWVIVTPTSTSVDTVIVFPDGSSSDAGTFVLPP